MYWHAKFFITALVVLLMGVLLYSFRSQIPIISSEKKNPEVAELNGGKSKKESKVLLTREKVKRSGQAGKVSSADSSLGKKLSKAKELVLKQEFVKARNIAENILLDPNLEPFGNDWMQVAELVSEINIQFLLTDTICPEKIDYNVKKNDNLVKIANHFNTTVRLLQKSNNLDETNSTIYPGQLFRVFKADWNIKVIKSRFLLILSDKKRLVKVYKVGTGRQDRTPAGIFLVDLKEFEPDWWQPGRLVKFGDPENVLGTRWMSLSPTENTNPALRGYGIHGTWEPDSIGHAASQGCVRMVNEQVEELYDIVPTGTRVVIAE